MNRTDKTATELIADMECLQAQYDACKCVGCGQKLDTYVQFAVTAATCRNKQCRRVDITLELDVLQSLSNADLDAKLYPNYSVNLAQSA